MDLFGVLYKCKGGELWPSARTKLMAWRGRVNEETSGMVETVTEWEV